MFNLVSPFADSDVREAEATRIGSATTVPRLQTPLSTLLWLTLAVTCLFAEFMAAKNQFKERERILLLREQLADRLLKSVDAQLKDMTPEAGFRYFSGNLRKVNNHPAMYAHGTGEDEQVVVVGRHCDEEFPMEKFDDAVKRYKKLLRDQGYHP
jgi:hypothetical protein